VHDGTLLQRLPYVALVSCSEQFSCLLLTYSCWDSDFGMDEQRRRNSVTAAADHTTVAIFAW